MTLNPLVSVEWLSNNLDIPNLVILDASTLKNKSKLEPEFPGTQIKNAIPFNMETTFYDKKSAIPNMIPSPQVFTEECKKLGINSNSIIVVYDNLGIYTSPRAWWMFKAMGHQYVAVLDGGLSAWKKAGLPWESIVNNKKYELGDFQANYQPELVVDSKTILKNLQNKDFVVIDARSELRFTGSIPEPRVEMASGHIPNSRNVPYALVLENGKMKSKGDIEKAFEVLHLKNEHLIFTCGSGVTACIILLASEFINSNKKSLYDGSWSEWGQLGKFPVEAG